MPFSHRDLRARLELAVDHILEACSRVECLTDTDCTTTSNCSSLPEYCDNGQNQPEFLMNSPLVTTIVRRELAVAIRDLIQHGMVTVIYCNSTPHYMLYDLRLYTNVLQNRLREKAYVPKCTESTTTCYKMKKNYVICD